MHEQIRSNKFRDPVHGFIYVSDAEKTLIDSVPFQRLRNIKQLALTNYIYHGAEHTRFGHSIGVMHLVTRAFQSAVSKNRYCFATDFEENKKVISWLEQILRLIALTHDLGHPPFSHAAESLFPEKLDNNNENKATQTAKKKYYKHEDLTEFIILETEIFEIIINIGTNYKQEYGDSFDITPKMICDIYTGKLPGDKSIFTFLKTFMDSELDCDKMDYLLRDSLFCGVSYGKFDVERLLACLTIFTKSGIDAPFLGIESGGIQAFEEFVLARYFMFVQVYFHRTRRYFDILLTTVLNEQLPDGVFPINVSDYLQWDDIKVIQLLKEASKQNDKAKQIIERKPLTCVYYTKTHPDGDGLKLLEVIIRALKKEFGAKTFKDHFIVDTSADKLPHKIVPRKHMIDDEEVIAIVNSKSHSITTISDESHVINNLTEKINVQRIYVDNEFVAGAKSVVDSLTVEQIEEELDYE